ncbi:MAG: hypothetical protein QG577_2487 [Thermodesulfobacteriota bacterium]|nr:hypothetical protein [Thermodesulfobacteriota bacterium]
MTFLACLFGIGLPSGCITDLRWLREEIRVPFVSDRGYAGKTPDSIKEEGSDLEPAPIAPGESSQRTGK